MFVLLYPGQGSQAPGMGQWLFDNFPVARETFDEASETLKQDLRQLCFKGSDAELALTENTQPALLCVSTATQRVLRRETGLRIQAAAGHSIGEYAALVSADSIRFDEAMRAVRARGQAMQSAVPVGDGGMTAVLGLEDDQIAWLCEWTEKNSGFKPVSAANFNSPGQVVISGSKKALDWLKDNFKPEDIPGQPRRAKLIPLNVSAPFHCAMMKPAEEKMRLILGAMEFKAPEFPICQNFTAKLEKDPAALRENLIRQISAPVLWTASMKHLRDLGMTKGVECGHGAVVRGLVKKIDASFDVAGMNSLEDLKSFEEKLKASGH